MNKLTFDVDRVYEFFREKGQPIIYSADLQAIANERDGVIIGGVLYNTYSHTNIFMHVAGTDGVNWISKDLLKAGFAYPFIQLGCKRVSGWVEASNHKARRFDEHLGFKQEAVLEGAARDGGDVIIYRMWRDECRFL